MQRLLQQAYAKAQAEQSRGCDAQVQERMSRQQRKQFDDEDIEVLNVGIEQCRKLQDRRGERALVEMLGTLHFMQENYRAAAQTQQALITLADEPADRAAAWEALGRSFLAAGDHANALRAYGEAFEIATRAAEPDSMLQAQALRGQGLVHLDRRDYASAVGAFERALALSRKAGDDPTSGGPILSSLGVAQLRAGDVKAAEASLRQAIEVPETIRSETQRLDKETTQHIPPAVRAILVQTDSLMREFVPHMAPLLVDGYTCSLLQELLATQRRDGEALEVSERCRGRALVQRLSLRQLPEEAQPPNLELIRAIAREQNATLVEYTIVYEPAAVPDWIADREAALLILVVAPDGTVTARRIALAPDLGAGLQSVAELVDVARDAIGARGRAAPPETSPPATRGSAAVRAESRLRQLHRLLVEPVADLLPRDPDARVIFVPQESLFLVPFAALQDSAGRYLIEKHTVSSAPSIHTLAFTRRVRRASQDSIPPESERTLIVGNPAMPSYPQAPGLAAQPLPDLPEAETEAKGVASLLRAQALTGAAATKAAFAARLPKAQMIHLATHGLLDDVNESRLKMPFARQRALADLMQPGTVRFRAPGSLALAPDPKDNGILTADEIAQLSTTAQLVVMSACDTGRGTIVGDGVVGLARSWMAAGVPSVVASLWAVPDKPTSELMLAFHQHLRQRPDKAWALRQAMLQTRTRYPSPAKWAAFVLIGEAD